MDCFPLQFGIWPMEGLLTRRYETTNQAQEEVLLPKKILS